MRKIMGMAGAIALMALAVPAVAHHSGAMFDQAKTNIVVGTVKEFKWASPHAWLYLVVPGPGGAAQPYDVELSSINIIARKGWSKSVVMPGQKVTVTVHPMRDGTMSGLMLTAKLPDGKVLTDHDY